MQISLRDTRAYAIKRLTGPAPLLLWAGLSAGSAFGSMLAPDASFDFGIFHTAGANILAGGNPYSGDGAFNMNAPASLLLFAPLGGLDVLWTPRGWFFASLLAYALSLAILWRLYPATATTNRLAWAIAQGGFWISVSYGEIYALLLPLLAITYWAARRDRLPVGGLVGGLLMAVKPNFALWPLLLLASGRLRVGLALLAGISFWGALPILAYGPVVYLEWLQTVRDHLSMILETPAGSSLPSLAFRLGQPWAGVPASAAMAAGLALWGWRTRPSLERAAPIGLLAGILASPAAWPGYVCFLVPGLLSREWNRPIWLAAALFLLPTWPSIFFGPDFLMLWATANTLAYGLLAVGLLLPPREECPEASPHTRSVRTATRAVEHAFATSRPDSPDC